MKYPIKLNQILVFTPFLISFSFGIFNNNYIPNSSAILGWEVFYLAAGYSAANGFGTIFKASKDVWYSFMIEAGNKKIKFFQDIEITSSLFTPDVWERYSFFGLTVNQDQTVSLQSVDYGTSIMYFLAFKILGNFYGAPYLFFYLIIALSMILTLFTYHNNNSVTRILFLLNSSILFINLFMISIMNDQISSQVTYRFIGIGLFYPLVFFWTILNQESKRSTFVVSIVSLLQSLIFTGFLLCHMQYLWTIPALIILLIISKLKRINAVKRNAKILLMSILAIVFLTSGIISLNDADQERSKTRLFWHSVYMGLSASKERGVEDYYFGDQRGVYNDIFAFQAGYAKSIEKDQLTWSYIFGNTAIYEKNMRKIVTEILYKHPEVYLSAIRFKLTQLIKLVLSVYSSIFSPNLTNALAVILFISNLLIGKSLVFKEIQNNTTYYSGSLFTLIIMANLFLLIVISYPQLNNMMSLIMSLNFLSLRLLFRLRI
jgi:hypothetical protein